MPAPTASATNVETLVRANLVPAQVGTFGLVPGFDPRRDKELDGLRGSSVTAPGGSFSRQLRDELVAELKAAGLYDEKSPAEISAQLADNRVDAAISVGTARLAAQFQVNRDGRKLFDKEVAAEASWESSFVGAVAIPTAINQYGALYKKLIGNLIGDPEFRKALAR